MASASSFGSSVLVLGDQTVGKKALVRQYLEHVPPSDQLTKIRSWQKIENIGGNLCPIEVRDLSNPWFVDYYVKRAQGSLVVFDLTNRKTFTNINVWLAKITKHARTGFVKVVVGNKCDLTNQRQVSREEAEQLAASHGMKYFETTATDHESTCGPFQWVLGQLFEARGGMTGLHRAASAGDVQAMHQLVADSPDQIDVRDDYGCSGYHYAAKNGHVNVIEGLVQRGSLLIDAPDKNGWTPMHTAAYFRQVGAMEALVRLGSKAIDTPDNEGSTPMHLAAMCGRVEVLEVLVRLGSRALDAPDEYGATLLHLAAQRGDVQAIEALVRLGSTSLDTPDNYGRTPLLAAAEEYKVEALEVLVRLGSRALDTPDNRGMTPMHATAVCDWAKGEAAETIKTLVRLGSQSIDAVNHKGKTPLHHTIRYISNIGAMEALVLWGSRAIDMPDNNGSTPMKQAIKLSEPDVVEALVRLGSCALDRPESLFTDGQYIYDSVQVVLAMIGIPQHFYHRSWQDDLTWSEDEAGDVRYRVYFSRSLAHRLLCATNCDVVAGVSRRLAMEALGSGDPNERARSAGQRRINKNLKNCQNPFELAAGRFFVLRCCAADADVPEGALIELHLVFGKNSCNPRAIQWCLLEERSIVTVFLQDIQAKAFLGFGRLESLALPPPPPEPHATASTRPPTMTKEHFPAPVAFRIRVVSRAQVPFSRTELLVNTLHPPSGKKSLSQATMGQEVDASCAGEAISFFKQAAAATSDAKHHKHQDQKQQQQQHPAHSRPAFEFSSDSNDAQTVLQGLLRAVDDRFGRPQVAHASLLGSRRYGVAVEGSDVDLFVVCLLGFERFCSVVDPPLQILQNPEHSKPDYTLVEAQTYCRMLIQGDPRVVESLFVSNPLSPCNNNNDNDNDDDNGDDGLLTQLIEHRSAFLTVQLVQKMLRDATSQRKMRALVSFDDRTTFLAASPAVLAPAARQKLWYLILRLLLHADEIVQEKTMSIPMPSGVRSELLELRSADARPGFDVGGESERHAAARCFALVDRLEACLAASPPPLPSAVSDATQDLVELELLRWRMCTARSCLSKSSSSSEQ